MVVLALRWTFCPGGSLSYRHRLAASPGGWVVRDLESLLPFSESLPVRNRRFCVRYGIDAVAVSAPSLRGVLSSSPLIALIALKATPLQLRWLQLAAFYAIGVIFSEFLPLLGNYAREFLGASEARLHALLIAGSNGISSSGRPLSSLRVEHLSRKGRDGLSIDALLLQTA